MSMSRVPFPASAGSIAAAIALAVANIDNPSAELGAIAGTQVGELRLCYQALAGANPWTLYAWDDAASGGQAVPYTVNGSAGRWIAFGGKYTNSAVNVAAAITVAGTGAFTAITLSDANMILGNPALASAQQIHRNRQDQSLTLIGGDGAAFGANVAAWGPNHASLPSRGRLRVSTNSILEWSSTAVTLGSGINFAMSGASTATFGTGTTTFNGALLLHSVGSAGVVEYTLRNTTNGTGSLALIRLANNVGDRGFIQVASATFTGNRLGSARANAIFIGSTEADRLLLGATNNVPVILGTNDAEYLRMASGAVSVASNVLLEVTNQTDGVSTGATSRVLRLYGGTSVNGGGVVLTGSTNATPSTGILRVAGSDILTWNATSVTLANGINFVMAGASTFTSGTGAFVVNGAARLASTVTVATAAPLDYDLTGSAFPPPVQVNGINGPTASIGISRWSENPNSPTIIMAKSRGATIGTHTIVQAGDRLFQIIANGSDGTVFRTAAQISVEATGTPASGYVPGLIRFWTTDNSGTLATRATLDYQALTLASGINLAMSGASTATFGTGVVSMPGTTASTSTTTGALVVSGGVGIAGDQYIGGVAEFKRASTGTALRGIATGTLTGNVDDAFTGGISFQPTYTGASTVTRHNYINVAQRILAGGAALTDAAVFRFDAAASTHAAMAGSTTKATPGAVSAWVKINVNGTIMYMPAYTSTTD